MGIVHFWLCCQRSELGPLWLDLVGYYYASPLDMLGGRIVWGVLGSELEPMRKTEGQKVSAETPSPASKAVCSGLAVSGGRHQDSAVLETASEVEKAILGMETLNQPRCHLQLLLSSAVDRPDFRLTHLALLYPQTRQGHQYSSPAERKESEEVHLEKREAASPGQSEVRAVWSGCRETVLSSAEHHLWICHI